jgi:hypothetical protein
MVSLKNVLDSFVPPMVIVQDQFEIIGETIVLQVLGDRHPGPEFFVVFVDGKGQRGKQNPAHEAEADDEDRAPEWNGRSMMIQHLTLRKGWAD